MKRFFVFLTGFSILLNCGSFQSQKTIKLGDGKEATVFFETQQTESGETILVVEFTNEELIRKESVLEKHVIEIWAGLETDAARSEVEEAVIKYRYFTGNRNGQGKKIYDGHIFTADKTENGRWSIRRVN